MIKKIIIAMLLCCCLFNFKTYGTPTVSGCEGTTITTPACADAFLDLFPGGTWHSSDETVAIVDPVTGEVTLIGPGSATITYTVTTECGTFTFSYEILVNPLPADITGPSSVCVGGTITLTGSPAGGSWSSSSGAATVVDGGSGTGIVTGVSSGTAIITYMLPTGCYKTKMITVNQAVISGPGAVCSGSTITLVGTPPGGTWSLTNNTGTATISSGGVVTGVTPGTVTVTYTASTGCYDTEVIQIGAPFNIQVCEIAPIETCDSIISYCTGLVLKVSGAPAGATFTWNGTIPATKTMSGTDAIYTFTSAPGATATYTVTASYEGCSATDIVTIVVAKGVCSPCDRFKPACTEGCSTAPFTTILSNMITSSVVSTTTPKNYFIASRTSDINAPFDRRVDTLVVSPAPGSVFAIDTGMLLVVRKADSVLLDSCHFFSDHYCPWRGIEVRVDASSAGRLKLTNNTLIEHVVTNSTRWGAVNVHQTGLEASSLPPAGSKIINSDEAIYNQDQIGISISFFTQTTLPFVIRKSVFTNREFCGYHLPGSSSCADYYPFTWPTVDYLKTQTATGNNPSFNIDNYTGLPSIPHSSINRYGGEAGITLNTVGQTAGTPVVYSSILIGDSSSSDNTNLFDTLLKGVDITGSNTIFYNNIFRKMQTSDANSNVGIYGATQSNSSVLIVDNNTVHPNTNNRFYNCRVGVFQNGARNFECYNALFSSSNYYYSTTNKYERSEKGIDLITSTTANDNYNVQNNSFTNIKQGVVVTAVSGGCSTTKNIVIRKNQIQALTSASGNEWGYSGIAFSDAGSCSNVRGNVYIDTNLITGNVVGIDVGATGSNMGTFATYIDHNTIKIINNAVPFANPSRTGIICRDTFARSISNNLVYGDTVNSTGYNSPAASVSSGTFTGYIGIDLTRVGNRAIKTTVSCNYTSDLNCGFRFRDTSRLEWRNNLMMRHQYGMILQKNYTSGIIAYIGQQGTQCDPSDNVWADDGKAQTLTGWTGWSASGVYETYVLGQSPYPGSILYVRPNGTIPSPYTYYDYTPVYNGAVSNGGSHIGVAYTASGGSPSIVDSTAYCSPLPEPVTCDGAGSPGGEGASRPVWNDNTTNLVSEYNLARFRVFPNPSNGDITIKQDAVNNAIVAVRILNYVGATIYSNETLRLKEGSADIHIDNATPGMYLIEVRDNKGTSTFKVVVQK